MAVQMLNVEVLDEIDLALVGGFGTTHYTRVNECVSRGCCRGTHCYAASRKHSWLSVQQSGSGNTEQ